MATEAGSIEAAPAPCTTRLAISSSLLPAKPQTIQAPAKSTSPSSSARRCPKYTAMRPATIISAASANR